MKAPLNIPTELHLMFLASQCEAFILIKREVKVKRWFGYLHASASNRVLRNYSHVSHRRVVKVLLVALEKRLASHQKPPNP